MARRIHNGTTNSSEGNSRLDRNNRSDQLNPNNDAYWKSRGHDRRPDDWKSRLNAIRVDRKE